MNTNIFIFSYLRRIALVEKTLSWFPEFQMRLRQSFGVETLETNYLFLSKSFQKGNPAEIIFETALEFVC